MSQTLTYVIGSDRRPRVDNIQDFKVDFSDDNHNWVQARQFERGMRQVFVNVANEDGTPFDLTGCNVWFEGLLPKTADGDFRVIDDKGYVALDPSAGRFRFDMPGHAFTVAGSYRQAFFRIVKNGNSVTTLEFDLDVLADKVIDGLVPKNWISPFEEIADKLVDDLQKHTDSADKIIADFQKKVGDLIAQLNQQGSTTTSMLTELQNRIADLKEEIKQENIVKEPELKKFEQTIESEIAKLKLPDVINVKDCGAIGDGVTDDAAAFQKAINTGQEIFIPNGTYEVDTTLVPKDDTTLLVMRGQTPGKVILKSKQDVVIDFTTTKNLVLSNLASDKIIRVIKYDGQNYDNMTNRNLKLDYIWNTSDDKKAINWDHLLTTPRMPEGTFDKKHSGPYSRYPLEIYNNGGYNALMINNQSQSVEASAIGITDDGGKEKPLSTPTILIGQHGRRNWIQVLHSDTQYPFFEAGTGIAINSKVSTDDFGTAGIKVGASTWPTIKLIERDTNSMGAISYNNNAIIFNTGGKGDTRVTSTGISTGDTITIHSDNTNGVLFKNANQDDPHIHLIYQDSNGVMRIAAGYEASPDVAGGRIQYCQAGPSDQRPVLTSNPSDIGFMFYDRTLGKPIWWSGKNWVSADVETVPLGKQVANLTAQNAELKTALSTLGKQTAQLIAKQNNA